MSTTMRSNSLPTRAGPRRRSRPTSSSSPGTTPGAPACPTSSSDRSVPFGAAFGSAARTASANGPGTAAASNSAAQTGRPRPCPAPACVGLPDSFFFTDVREGLGRARSCSRSDLLLGSVVGQVEREGGGQRASCLRRPCRRRSAERVASLIGYCGLSLQQRSRSSRCRPVRHVAGGGAPCQAQTSGVTPRRILRSGGKSQGAPGARPDARPAIAVILQPILGACWLSRAAAARARLASGGRGGAPRASAAYRLSLL